MSQRPKRCIRDDFPSKSVNRHVIVVVVVVICNRQSEQSQSCVLGSFSPQRGQSGAATEDEAIELAFQAVASENGTDDITLAQAREIGHLNADALRRLEEEHSQSDDRIDLQSFEGLKGRFWFSRALYLQFCGQGSH